MQEEKLLIAKIMDKIKQFEKSTHVVCSNFLSPAEAIEVENLVKKYPASFYGGYEGAERKILFLSEHEVNYIEYIQVISITSQKELTHRAVLGSVLGLGIKREMIGDILIQENQCDFIVCKEMAEYILDHLKKVGREKVEVKKKEITELITKKENRNEIRVTVASLRLDAVISAGLGLARGLSLRLIEAEKVHRNYKIVTSPSKSVEEGDLLSVRGYGRIELVEIIGQTRKGRISIRMNRY